MVCCAYVFERKQLNNNHQLPNNLHPKNVSLKYRFYKQTKKGIKKMHTHNNSKFMTKTYPLVFLLCTLLGLSINKCMIKSRDYKHT